MKKNKSGLLIGLPTIVNVLALLAFSCISLLSLSRAKADFMAAQHTRDVSQDYYAADSRAQTLLDTITPEDTTSEDEAGVEMEAALNDQGISARYDTTTNTLEFVLPAGEAGTISIAVKVHPSGAYTIKQWKLLPHES